MGLLQDGAFTSLTSDINLTSLSTSQIARPVVRMAPGLCVDQSNREGSCEHPTPATSVSTVQAGNASGFFKAIETAVGPETTANLLVKACRSLQLATIDVRQGVVVADKPDRLVGSTALSTPGVVPAVFEASQSLTNISPDVAEDRVAGMVHELVYLFDAARPGTIAGQAIVTAINSLPPGQ